MRLPEASRAARAKRPGDFPRGRASLSFAGSSVGAGPCARPPIMRIPASDRHRGLSLHRNPDDEGFFNIPENRPESEKVVFRRGSGEGWSILGRRPGRQPAFHHAFDVRYPHFKSADFPPQGEPAKAKQDNHRQVVGLIQQRDPVHHLLLKEKQPEEKKPGPPKRISTRAFKRINLLFNVTEAFREIASTPMSRRNSPQTASSRAIPQVFGRRNNSQFSGLFLLRAGFSGRRDCAF